MVDAFKNFEGSEEEKNAMLGYITRAKMTDRAFSSLRGYFVVPDEENKKLIITEAIGEGEEKFFICHRCTDLTTFNNAKNINYWDATIQSSHKYCSGIWRDKQSLTRRKI